ncbi:hypothetical protein BC831DRAFT_32639 [Entophlyctis helioformis]|nr:hypothetical protein BC831DRAFT_32639 [Entophlyctis helioformis]
MFCCVNASATDDRTPLLSDKTDKPDYSSTTTTTTATTATPYYSVQPAMSSTAFPPSFTALDQTAVRKFQEYLRIKTVQPNPDYAGARKFLQSYAAELGLAFRVVEMVPGKPICILSWIGKQPSLKSVMLNSHIDVVPVSEEHWTHDPFGAVKLLNGDIVARGAQDMKCVGIGYLEAIRVLKAKGVQLERTLHATFVPDEEIGGHDGMKLWVKTEDFRSLNIGFALDEGLANNDDCYKVYYGERAPWWMRVTTSGGAGHGSQFIEPLATERLVKVLNKFLAFRDSEKQRLAVCRNEAGRKLTLGDVTTTNITLLDAGVQFNVIPETASAGIDMRVAPSVDLQTFRQTLISWCQEEGAELEFVQAFMSNVSTPLTASNVWWQQIAAVASDRGVKLEPEIFPAATDSRFLREIGLPAIGISAIRNTPVLLHDHNEYLNEVNLIEGVQFYVDLLPRLANVSASLSA